MQTIDKFAPPKAAGLAVLLLGVNPKNLLLAVGAAAAIAQTGASSGQQAVAVAVFILWHARARGAGGALLRARRALSGDPRPAEAWMSRDNAIIMAVLCLVIGGLSA